MRHAMPTATGKPREFPLIGRFNLLVHRQILVSLFVNGKVQRRQQTFVGHSIRIFSIRIFCIFAHNGDRWKQKFRFES